ncbi:MAG: RagB/SusD family nutrient uptake outer membrane protein [Ginsengibacter sp.]
MKLKFIIPALLITAICTESCKKNLEETAYSFLSTNTVFSSETGLKQATLGVYDSWRADPIFDPVYQWTLAEAGQQYVTSGMIAAGIITPFYNFNETPSDLNVTNVWPRYYQTIARANTVIAHAGEAVKDSVVANTYKAEARFLRAYAYFMLVRDFGGVPLIKTEINSIAQSDQIFATQSSVQDVYNFIIQDLQFSETHLPAFWTGNDLGRISAGAAKALLGKVYLTGAGLPLKNPQYYQLAVSKLNEIVGSSNEAKYNFGLLPKFSDVFSNKNKHNKEIVFSWSNAYSSANSHNGTLFPFFLLPTGLAGTTQTGYGLTQAFYNLYENSDTRRDVTVISRYVLQTTGDSIIYDNTIHHYINKTQGGAIYGDATIQYVGMAYGKLARDPIGSKPTASSVDLIQMRFSDVLLCLAEALNETGNSGDAVALVNRVRARAGATQYSVGSQDQVRNEIRLERRLELTGEYTTVFDIRRWGTLKNEIAAMDPAQVVNNDLGAYASKFELYPIPQAEIDANPNLKQNPGY